MRVVYFGVYDLGKPRVRILLEALRGTGAEVIEVHADVWAGVEDKSQTSLRARAFLGMSWLFAYPRLVWRYLRAPRHDVVVTAYPAILDTILVRPLAALRGVPIVVDAFVSIYDTVVNDRKILKSGTLATRLLKSLEKRSCRCADLVILDTKAHAELFIELFKLPADRLASVMVGAESDHFPRLPPTRRRFDEPIKVLFYGQFIPLHGVPTIIEAARLARDEGERIKWVLIGTGQEANAIRSEIASDPIPALTWIEWVPYEELIHKIKDADVALGIFGTSAKAARVIPNKVFQILSAGRPLVTMDSPAIRELVSPPETGIRLVPPSDARALLAAIRDLAATEETPSPLIAERFAFGVIGPQYSQILTSLKERSIGVDKLTESSPRGNQELGKRRRPNRA